MSEVTSDAVELHRQITHNTITPKLEQLCHRSHLAELELR